MNKRKHILASLLLLSLFLAYQASVTMFTHAHIVNGVMIVHSHPSSQKQHTHTEGQVITIAHLASFHGVEPDAGVEVVSECPVLYVLDCLTDTFRVLAPHTHCIHLRAPPFSC